MHNNHDVLEIVGRNRIGSRRRGTYCVLLAALLLGTVLPPSGFAQGSGRERRRQPGASESDMDARRLLVRARELLDAFETERGVRMLESVAEQYPASRVRFEAWLALGKHYLDVRDQTKAVHYLGQIRALYVDGETLAGDDLERYLESLYLTGVAHFQVRQYGPAFTALRRITNLYPNTVWANQAYYYIGMCHFAQQNWSKAIEALSLVGTFADADGPTADLVEAGRRIYVKVQDADLPVLTALGGKVQVQIETQSGDSEQIECVPLAVGADVFIGSIQTSPGPLAIGDGVLQVIGGDVIITHYMDENDQAGTTNVLRETRTRVVGTGTLGFTLGDLETMTPAVFLDQPLFLLLQDLDLDLTSAADTAEVRIVARYKDEEDASSEQATAGSLHQFMQAGDVRWITRDEVRVNLVEIGTPPVIRTGKFGGSVMVQALSPEQPANLADSVLTCQKGDEIIAYYEDALHIGGDSLRVVEAKAVVAGAIDNRPRASQDVVSDPLIRGKKNIVEATAYLELARIFKSMGLMHGARERTKDGLERVDALIRSRDPVSVPVRQQAFKLKWELHMAADDFDQAIAVCRLFNQMYPDSPFADSALLGIANIHMDNDRDDEALKIFRQILLLRHSDTKAEAQFRIAELVEKQPGAGAMQRAVQEYRLCAERYPESHFAGKALAKVVDYHIETRDFVQADILLQQIFQDYPDAAFLDGMLLKWVLVAFRANQFQKAHAKCNQLIFDYPESPFAERAKQIMPRIESRLGQAGTGSATGDQ